jgi:hypothetical protein
MLNKAFTARLQGSLSKGGWTLWNPWSGLRSAAKLMVIRFVIVLLALFQYRRPLFANQPVLSNSLEPVKIGTDSRVGRISRTFDFVFLVSQMKQLKFS